MLQDDETRRQLGRGYGRTGMVGRGRSGAGRQGTGGHHATRAGKPGFKSVNKGITPNKMTLAQRPMGKKPNYADQDLNELEEDYMLKTAPNRFDMLSYPGYEYKPYPKWVRQEGKPDTLVQDEEEHKALLHSWGHKHADKSVAPEPKPSAPEPIAPEQKLVAPEPKAVPKTAPKAAPTAEQAAQDRPKLTLSAKPAGNKLVTGDGQV